MYICPVCGYDQLEDPPTDYNICECCGTEFGYHDAHRSHAELRQRWIMAGMPWWDRRVAPPPGWNPVTQLSRAGFSPLASTG
jgi:hypothetical protein